MYIISHNSTMTPSLSAVFIQCGQTADKIYKIKKIPTIGNQSVGIQHVTPLGIEPKSKEPESFILSV